MSRSVLECASLWERARDALPQKFWEMRGTFRPHRLPAQFSLQLLNARSRAAQGHELELFVDDLLRVAVDHDKALLSPRVAENLEQLSPQR
jgi:hypothetical protein